MREKETHTNKRPSLAFFPVVHTPPHTHTYTHTYTRSTMQRARATWPCASCCLRTAPRSTPSRAAAGRRRCTARPWRGARRRRCCCCSTAPRPSSRTQTPRMPCTRCDGRGAGGGPLLLLWGRSGPLCFAVQCAHLCVTCRASVCECVYVCVFVGPSRPSCASPILAQAARGGHAALLETLAARAVPAASDALDRHGRTPRQVLQAAAAP